MSENPYSATQVGARIKRVRGLRGWTQAEMAERSKLSRGEISLWETGRQRPSPEKAVKLCRALGIELNYLVSGSTQYLRHDVALEIIGTEPEPQGQVTE